MDIYDKKAGTIADSCLLAIFAEQCMLALRDIWAVRYYRAIPKAHVSFIY
jgi:hypothetical protein